MTKSILLSLRLYKKHVLSEEEIIQWAALSTEMLLCSHWRQFIGLGKYLTHSCHPTTPVKTGKKFSGIRILGNFGCYGRLCREGMKSNSLPLHVGSKFKSTVIYKQTSRITWHIRIFKLKMWSIISYLSEHKQ